MTRRLTRLTDILLRQHAALVLLLHVSLISWSLVSAWMLRYEFVLRNPSVVFSAAPILVILRLAAMSRFRLLHGHWRYTNIEDAADILKATLLGSIGFFVTIRFVLGVRQFPLSVYIFETILTGCLLAGVRIAFRVMAEAASRIAAPRSRKQVLVIGAGFGAQMVLRELRASTSGYWVVGCLDDDSTKVGLKILGKPVLGTVGQLKEVAEENRVEEILIAVPSASGPEMQRFVRLCQEADLKFYTVPALQDLVSGKARIEDVREVNLDDLLGREPVRIDLEAVKSVITGKSVMVTGAAGSIGSELCRQILRYRPAKLICLDQSETGLFYLELELGRERTVYCVADYTHTERMRRIFETHQIDILFHAAAYKHVPMMEANVREALLNNVFGLMSLLDVAEEQNCGSFVMISSDKAVNPTNVMGASKRIGELLLASRPASAMRCVSVRFGNVLGSQGSVVPVFQKQIAERKRITVTHPDITRFFMTIAEAVSLVLQASAIGQHGDVLVLDMGNPIRIVELARTLIRLSGRSEKDVEITFTGLRPGEKLYEELFYSDEIVSDTKCLKIKQTHGLRISWSELKKRTEALRASMFEISDMEIRSHIHGIVKEYAFEGMEQESAVSGSFLQNSFSISSLAESYSDD